MDVHLYTLYLSKAHKIIIVTHTSNYGNNRQMNNQGAFLLC